MHSVCINHALTHVPGRTTNKRLNWNPCSAETRSAKFLVIENKNIKESYVNICLMYYRPPPPTEEKNPQESLTRTVANISQI